MSTDGLDELLNDMRTAPARVVVRSVSVAKRTALEVKKGMAEDARRAAPQHAPHFPDSISYDVDNDRGQIVAEIGPDKQRSGKQGALGNILAFGTRNNAPVWDHDAALDRETPVMLEHLADAGEEPFT